MNPRQQLANDLGSRVPGCSVGLKFGHGALEVEGKVFAFTRTDESAALKLPAPRIADLIVDHEIQHLKMGQRTMREWVIVPNIAAPHNLKLLQEAMAYVASLPRTERRKLAKKTAEKKSTKITPKKEVRPR